MRDVARALQEELRAQWADDDVIVRADLPEFDPPSARIVIRRGAWSYERRLKARELDAGAELVASCLADECAAEWSESVL